MLQTLHKLNALLDPRDRGKVVLLLILMIATAFMQTAGIASVMPFLAVLSDPGMVHDNEMLRFAYEWLGFESTSRFLYFLGLAAFVLFMTGTALQAFNQWAITRFTHMQQYELSRRLMGDYLSRPFTFFLNRNSGDLAKTVLQETTQAINGALMPALKLASQLLLAAFIIALLVVVQPWLALIAAAGLGGIYAVIYVASRTWLNRIGLDRVEANRERFTPRPRPLPVPRRSVFWGGSVITWSGTGSHPSGLRVTRRMRSCCRASRNTRSRRLHSAGFSSWCSI